MPPFRFNPVKWLRFSVRTVLVKRPLIKILATLLKPTSGGLEIEGTDAIADFLDVRSALGVVIHEMLAYPAFTPYENLKFFGQMYGVKQLEDRATTLLAEVGLQRFTHEPLHISFHAA